MTERLERPTWYHGTPDRREIVANGGFEERFQYRSYIADLDQWNSVQPRIAATKSSGDEAAYFRLLDEASDLRQHTKFIAPIYFTDSRKVAATYAAVT